MVTTDKNAITLFHESTEFWITGHSTFMTFVRHPVIRPTSLLIKNGAVSAAMMGNVATQWQVNS